MLEVARLNRQRRDELFAELAAGWTGSPADEPSRGELRRGLVQHLGELAHGLAPRREAAASGGEDLASTAAEAAPQPEPAPEPSSEPMSEPAAPAADQQSATRESPQTAPDGEPRGGWGPS